MLAASISEAKNKLSALIDRVKAGETVLILDRGRPVARLEPAPSIDEADDARIVRLERAGILRRGKRWGESLILPPAVKTLDGSSVVEALLEERREGH